ncbi:ATP-grasp domain [Seminavis robusta]|uniref:ATP-grasp domain n=1 Tax=Seminavis robusta TaxID=568900 RepID=A0A9N8I072_9STRA|nr:ATP-grasp domain [Seminavis robusta]|eukprot:Sro3498_g348650.1 ATP-grasp domain (500) ;mRNA; f:1528-3027
MSTQDRNLLTMASDLSLSDPFNSQVETTIRSKVVIFSGGPLASVVADFQDEKKADDGSSAPSTADVTAAPSLASLGTNPATESPKVSSVSSVLDYRAVRWCGTKFYSDLVHDGLEWLGKPKDDVVMVYESPSYETPGTSFVNASKYFFHDSPAGSPIPRTTLGPLRYGAMTGDAFPVYLQNQPDAQLVNHWKNSLPHFVEPRFVHGLKETNRIYAYLPLEQVANHVHDPQAHYHVAGKDAIPLMTTLTTKLLPDTKQVRPCIAKVNHSMGSRGIFVIRDDNDENEFLEFLQETGNPPYVVSEFINIVRNIACHFFIHPDGRIVWLGSSENVRLEDGTWSADSTMDRTQQDILQALQLPGARDVADYCLSLGLWGFCGIDVLIDDKGQGHVVDVNPRVTGTCPALMAFRGMQKRFGFDYGLFRRSTSHAFPGSLAQLLEQVEAHNANHEGESRIVLFSVAEKSADQTLLNMGVYGKSLEDCEVHLNHFSRVFRYKKATYM